MKNFEYVCEDCGHIFGDKKLESCPKCKSDNIKPYIESDLKEL